MTTRTILAATALAALLVAGAAAVVSGGQTSAAPSPAQPWTANLADLRRAATAIPGGRPLRINMRKFAESRRTKNFSVKGAPADPSVQARTVFQLVYTDGTVMVDAGMDQQVHRFFGRGVEEPYDAAAASEVARAVEKANLIVVTHEHGDHVAGVIRPPQAAALAARTILTRTQVETLMRAPQMPEIRLTAEQASRYIVVDYDRYLPIAPGVAAVKAAGHTPGSQMIFVTLASGREYLLIGDVTWHMDGVRQMIGKDAPWITEDTPAILAQLQWLNGLQRSEPGLVLVASHDEDQHRELLASKELGARLE